MKVDSFVLHSNHRFLKLDLSRSKLIIYTCKPTPGYSLSVNIAIIHWADQSLNLKTIDKFFFLPLIQAILSSSACQLSYSNISWACPLFVSPATNTIRSLLSHINEGQKRGAWVAQSVKRPTSAQVMISRSVSSSPASGSVLTAQSLEPVSDSVSSSLWSSPVHALSLSVSKINKRLKK